MIQAARLQRSQAPDISAAAALGGFINAASLASARNWSNYAGGGALMGAAARVAKAHLRKELGGAFSPIVWVASSGSPGPSSDDSAR